MNLRKTTSTSLNLKGSSKTHQSSLTLKGGSTSHLGFLPSGKKRKPPYSVLKPLRYKVGGPSEVYASSGAAVFCAGMNPPSLKDLLRGCLLVAFFENLPVLLFLIKRAALGNLKVNFHCAHFAQPFPSWYRGCANRPFNSLYDPFGSPCRGQKRCSNRYAIWMADHQRSTPAAELRIFVRDEPQGHTMQDTCSMLMEPHGYDEECSMLIARNLLRLLLMGTQGHE